MKILHVVKTFAPAGGIETYVIDLLARLEKKGHTNALIYREHHPRTPAANGRAIFHFPISGNSQHDRAQILQQTAQVKPNVIYLHDVYDPILFQEISKLAPSVAYVHIFYPVCPGLGKLFHRTDEICTRPFGLGCIYHMYADSCATARHPRSVLNIMRRTQDFLDGYRNIPRVIVASQYMADLMAQNGISRERLAVVPYYVPLPHESEIIAPTENSRDIMFAGRLDYEKGIPYLLRAMKRIPKPHKLLIAGDGSLGKMYRQMVVDMGLQDRVKFLGWLSGAELDEAYRRCAVTVMPTIMAEPFGKVGVESMANGRPVVAFNVGGISDWLKDGINGYLVPPLDVQTLANRLARLVQSPELVAQMGVAGRKNVEEKYNAARHISRLESIFESVQSEARGIYAD